MTQADDIMVEQMRAGGSDASHQLRIPQIAAQFSGIDLPKGDKAIILEALKRLRNRAVSHKYGGMGRDYILAKAAIEALERLVG